MSLLTVTTAALLPMARAQDIPAQAATRTYAAQDFLRYAPTSALDMLQQVPGFVIRQPDQQRGLGEASGNVLLNGKRVSGKSSDVVDQLAKIPAAQVVRIEIRDGATLDVPGLSGQVANVVAKAERLNGTWSWEPDVRRYYTDPQLTRGALSLSGSAGRVDYTVGLDNRASHGGAGGLTTLHDGNGGPRETRDEIWTAEVDQPQLSTRITYFQPNGAIATVNASLQKIFYRYDEGGTRVRADGSGLERSFNRDQGGHNAEFGADYDFSIGRGRLKFIGLVRDGKTEIRDDSVLRDLDGTPLPGQRYDVDGVERENVVRAEYRWRQNGDWQLSAEYALNRLDSDSFVSTLEPDGTVVALPLNNGSDVVREDRYEAVATYGRTLRPNLSLQASAGVEYSRLGVGAEGATESVFRRPKGRLALAWQASDSLSLNAEIERRVGQLNFYDFLASVSLNDDRESVGNAGLVPPQIWELSLDSSKTLGRFGQTALRLYAQSIDDAVDIVPMGANGESPGNIDHARRWGADWTGTFNLDATGWQGARLDARLQFERSSTRDPLTDEVRPISGSLKRRAELGLRYDVPDTSWATGGNLSYVLLENIYRPREIGRTWEGPVWGSLFIERKDLRGLTVRLSANNLLGATSLRQRTVYQQRRTGPVDYVESRDRRIGPILSLSVSGAF